MIKTKLNELVENLVFAMGMDDEVPERILEDIFRQNKNKDPHVVNELESSSAVEDFNSEVDKKLKTRILSGLKLEPAIGQAFEPRKELVPEETFPTLEEIVKHTEIEPEEAFFDGIVGYSDIKKIMLKCSQKSKMHVILNSPPASAKSLFLEQMNNNLENSYYVDCTNATGPGMIKYLFEHDVEYLFLDEVEKMNKAEQNVLLNVMETGLLTSTKVTDKN